MTASPFEVLQEVFPTFDKNYYILKPVEIAELTKRINDIIAPNLPGHGDLFEHYIALFAQVIYYQ